MTTPAQKTPYLLVYMPYIALDDTPEITFGKARLVNATHLLPQITDAEIRQRVHEILNMHREGGRLPGKSRALSGIGVVVIGGIDFHQFTPYEDQLVRDLRTTLFLCCLANNNRLSGPNAGHSAYTSENFDVVYQKFELGSPYIAERSGVLVAITNIGFTIGETQFLKPSYVIRPLRFHTDDNLLRQLTWLRRRHRALYRRIVRAAAVFLESYYNAQIVDVRARILLQASAFEILLDLPDRNQRKAFKDEIERLTNDRKEKRFRYSFEVPGGRKMETRSVKGIWADRFYTLRNHIIHGESVRASEYVFRGKQHHLLIAPYFFVLVVKRLIDEARAADGLESACTDRLRWTVIQRADRYVEELDGFKVDTDFYALFEQYEARKARHKARKKTSTVHDAAS